MPRLFAVMLALVAALLITAGVTGSKWKYKKAGEYLPAINIGLQTLETCSPSCQEEKISEIASLKKYKDRATVVFVFSLLMGLWLVVSTILIFANQKVATKLWWLHLVFCGILTAGIVALLVGDLGLDGFKTGSSAFMTLLGSMIAGCGGFLVRSLGKTSIAEQEYNEQFLLPPTLAPQDTTTVPDAPSSLYRGGQGIGTYSQTPVANQHAQNVPLTREQLYGPKDDSPQETPLGHGTEFTHSATQQYGQAPTNNPAGNAPQTHNAITPSPDQHQAYPHHHGGAAEQYWPTPSQAPQAGTGQQQNQWSEAAPAQQYPAPQGQQHAAQPQQSAHQQAMQQHPEGMQPTAQGQHAGLHQQYGAAQNYYPAPNQAPPAQEPEHKRYETAQPPPQQGYGAQKPGYNPLYDMKLPPRGKLPNDKDTPYPDGAQITAAPVKPLAAGDGSVSLSGNAADDKSDENDN